MITLPFSSLPGTPHLFADYAENVSDARNYFMGHFSDLMAFETHLQQLERRSYLREPLYAALAAQNKSFLAGDNTFMNLELMKSPTTFAVVTGQQVGLFTGPLYTLYKAMTAVQLSRWLEEQFPSYRFVPMFWLESEDHDFLEINNAGGISAENEFFKVRYAQPEEDAPKDLKPVALRPIEGRIEDTIAELRSRLPATDFTEELFSMLRNAYAPGGSLQRAFARLFNALYPEAGVVFIDPSDPTIKQLATPVILQELETFPTTGEEVIKRSAELEERYHAQIKPRAVNLFAIHKENRFPIEPSEYGFFLKGTRQRYTRDELLELAGAEPERFSPNVLLRPIMQDFLLPTAAYVAGPSEVSYFAQLQPAYDHFQVPMPVIFPRASLTIVENKVEKVFRKFNLPYAAMFLDDEAAWRLVQSGEEHNERFDFAEFRARLAVLMEELPGLAEAEHPNLRNPAESTLNNMQRSLATFEDKLLHHRRQTDDVLTRQIEKMHVYLFPEGKPQERQVNIVTYLNRYGFDILRKIEDACVPFPAEHRMLFL
ncbi:MAG: bacillithiol biosynthesis cysteine-adding enzyme BshC [Bacteroidetes bacterium]|nr:bacillithiol biosynthesis cysteine-adding enzyme BshC [Bacteroidota bacterium]